MLDMRLTHGLQACLLNLQRNAKESGVHIGWKRSNLRCNRFVQNFDRPIHSPLYLKFEIIERAKAIGLPARAADSHFV
jgi:hypothetical protein